MLQDLDDLMQWLSDFGVRSAAFDRLRETLQGEQRFGKEQRSLATAVENVANLREELHMTNSQVRSGSGARPVSARAKRLIRKVRGGASFGTTSVLAGLTLNASCPPCVHACELNKSMQSSKPVRLGTTARTALALRCSY